jgi:hypothetical protein
MSNWLFKMLIALVVIGPTLGPPASALENGWSVQNGNILILVGDITYDSFDRDFLPAVKELKVADEDVVVALVSPGGSGSAALQIGAHIRAHGYSTAVIGPCYSACTLLAISGETRVIVDGTKLGWHSPHIMKVDVQAEGDTQKYGLDSSTKTFEDGFNGAIEMQRTVLKYAITMLGWENGTKFHAVGELTPAKEMYIFNRDDLAQLGFHTIEDFPSAK